MNWPVLKSEPIRAGGHTQPDDSSRPTLSPGRDPAFLRDPIRASETLWPARHQPPRRRGRECRLVADTGLGAALLL